MKDNNFEQFDARVDRFLRKQITAEEATAFKAELDSDPDKKERAKVIALMIKTMRKEGLKRDQNLVDEIKNMSEEEFRSAAGLKKKKQNLLRFRTQFVRYAAAACIVGLLFWGGIHYYEIHQTTSLGKSSYLAYTPDIADSEYIRGITHDDIVTQIEKLFANVENNRDIKTTIEQLTSLYNQSQDEISEYNYFIDDIAWNLAVAHLLDGDREKPIPILEGMVERNGDYPEISQPAQKLIEDIRNL